MDLWKVQPPAEIAPEEQKLRMEQHRVVEEILLREYEAASSAFDRARESSQVPDIVTVAVEHLIWAMHRLGRFLEVGEIPHDVATKTEAMNPPAGNRIVAGAASCEVLRTTQPTPARWVRRRRPRRRGSRQ